MATTRDRQQDAAGEPVAEDEHVTTRLPSREAVAAARRRLSSPDGSAAPPDADSSRADGAGASARRPAGRPSQLAPQGSRTARSTAQTAGGMQAKVAVPERPRLAPGVRLAGQMRESAFKNPPWLIEREDAGYVQVTELLYRIAELCDGRRTLAEIAEAVSERTGRTVSADNVKVLVGTQLVLKGLAPAANGRVVGGQGGARSLLALSLRNKVIGPKLLDGPAAVLQWLFWPPVLIAIIGAAIGSLAWLLLIHGLAAGGRQALYQPGLLLIALALTALAAGFHELGHAAALRYGGGRPKGMGVGLYLVYPAFYTDVSDNYRLPRWSRVRTDLGGVVFHLVFVLGVVGLYLLTGWELVLVAVPLLLLDAFRQLLPLIRLDGYWTLADLTGVPDFLSHVGAFVRRYLPGQDVPATLPELKWWGTLAFVLYIVLILPILGFMLFTMVRTTPTILATAWDSAGQLAGAFGEASGEGNGIGMASSAAQIAVLALPTAGLLYSLIRFGKRIALAVWRWSSPTPTRRVVGMLGTLGVLGLVGYLWAPQLPFGGSGPFFGSTRDSFAPIPADSRGTLFDAVGAPQPEWATLGAQTDASFPSAVPSPSPAVPGSGGAIEPRSAPSLTASVENQATATAETQATATAEASQTPATAVTPTTEVPTRGAPTAAVPAATPRTGAPAPPPAPAVTPGGAQPAAAPPAPVATSSSSAPAATVVRTPLPTATRALAP